MSFGFYGDPDRHLPPHPAIGLPVLLIVENAICAAWNLLRTHPRQGFDLLTADEDKLTHELYEALFDHVFTKGVAAGFDARLFSNVEREPKIRNYDRLHLDKMPDLLVRLVGRPPGVRNTQDGVFIECKPIDLTHGVLGKYCNKGLIRFVRVDYAWAMLSATMVGYVRGSYTISAKLLPALKNWPPGAPVDTIPHPCPRSKASSISEIVHVTEHSRSFSYIETSEPAPGITIRHLWLRRD